jgi:hypothetical protein
MPRHRPVVRLPTLLLALIVLLALAPAAAQAGARAHATHKRSACPASRSAHRTKQGKRRPSSCKSPKHASRHGVRVLHRPAGAQGPQQGPLGAVVAAPTCDDGSAPAAQGCGDGSEASNCPDGSTLERQSSGPGVCRAAPLPASSGEFSCEADAACSVAAPQPNCENGRDAVQAPGGYYVCADGSEPACEEAFTPVFSGDRLIACEPGSEDEEEESG